MNDFLICRRHHKYFNEALTHTRIRLFVCRWRTNNDNNEVKTERKKMLQMNSSHLMAKLEYIEIQEVYCACVYVMCEDKENV